MTIGSQVCLPLSVNKCMRQRGFSLLEVLIALAIMAIMAVLAFQSLDVAERSSEVNQEKLAEIEQLDRIWVLLENDLRNVLSYDRISSYGDLVPAMQVDDRDLHWLQFFRGGRTNPLYFPRTELGRVGYRLENEALWRDSWIDPANPDPDLAFEQKLLEGVDSVEVRVLLPDARSVEDGPWTDEWPPRDVVDVLPIAVEVTIIFEDEREITRLIGLAPGL